MRDRWKISSRRPCRRRIPLQIADTEPLRLAGTPQGVLAVLGWRRTWEFRHQLCAAQQRTQQTASLPPSNTTPRTWAYGGINFNNLIDGHVYQVEMKATDSAGNIPAVWQPGTVGGQPYAFTYTVTAPTSTLISPAPDLTAGTTVTYMTNSIAQPFTTLSGAAIQHVNGTPDVAVRIVDITNPLQALYLLPSCTSFVTVDPGYMISSNATYLTGTTSQLNVTAGVWTLTVSTGIWTNKHIYQVYTQAYDGINYETSSTLPAFEKGAFRIDTRPGTSGVLYPLPPSLSGGLTLAYEDLSMISGTASDINDGPDTNGYSQDSGIRQVQIQIQNTDPANLKYYSPVSQDFTSTPSTWVNCANATVYTSSVNWVNTVISTSAWKNGITYEISVRSIDNAGNVETAGPGFNFLFDASTPTVISTAPVAGDYNQPVINYFGTIANTPSGIDTLSIRISRASDGLVWYGDLTQWQTDTGGYPNVTSIVGTSPGDYNWSYTASAFPLSVYYAVAPDTITVTLYANDNTYDVSHSTISSALTYVYETVPPVSTVQAPPQGAFYNVTTNPLTMLTGSATDYPGGFAAGISTVQVKIMYEPNNAPVDAANQYWNGSAWQSGVAYATATLSSGTTFWSLPFNANNWITSAGAQYIVMSHAFVNGRTAISPYSIQGTPEAIPAINNSGGTNYQYFIIDTTAPTTAVTTPNTSPAFSFTSIIGTAADAAPGVVTQVKVAYHDLSNNNWWDPVAQTVPFTLAPVAGQPPAAAFLSTPVIAGVWTLTGTSTPTWISGTTYEIFAMAVDIAGNQTPFPGVGNAAVLPTAATSYVQFLYQEPPAQSALSAPAPGTYFKSSALGAVSGTSANADAVKIKITYYGADGIKGTPDDLVWNGGAFVVSPPRSPQGLRRSAILIPSPGSGLRRLQRSTGRELKV